MHGKWKFLALLVVSFAWTNSQPLSTTYAGGLNPYCGDGSCQGDGCYPGGPGEPGNGCDENRDNCGQDCGYCGDGACQIGFENPTGCPQDCGYCGDSFCNPSFENSGNCPGDCPPGGGGPGGPVCPGNGCEQGENCVNCASDCGICFCGNTVCETAAECGGGGSMYSPCGPYEPIRDYCPQDCGACDEGHCLFVENGKVCDDDGWGNGSGRCVEPSGQHPCPTGWCCVTAFPENYCALVPGGCPSPGC